MIAALYTDGGLILGNPSPFGGTWAYCQVDEHNERIESGSAWGMVYLHQFPGWPMTNNVTEMAAVIRGLESLPLRWQGTIYCDSKITIERVSEGASMEGIPDAMIQRLALACRRVCMPRIQWIHVAGHPTRAELAAGVSVEGVPVSRHNVWCDTQCKAVATRWKAKHPEEVARWQAQRRRRQEEVAA